MNLPHIICILPVNMRRRIISIFHSIRIFPDSAVRAVQKFLQRGKVIGIHCGEHTGQHLRHFYFPGLPVFLRSACTFRHHGGQIQSCALNLKRIFRHCLFFNRLDIVIYPGRQGQYQRDPDNTDGTCKRGQKCPRLFCFQIIKAQRQGRQKRHGRLSHISVSRLFHLLFVNFKRICI